MKLATLRASLAIRLVKIASKAIDRSFAAHLRAEHDNSYSEWRAVPVHFYVRQINRITLTVAKKLDYDATGQQMIEESWWG